MKPKYRYTAETDIPEALKAYYTKGADGTWTIDVDGAADGERLKEFRENNINLTKEVADLKKTWEGLSPEEVKALIAKKAEIEAQKSKDKGEIEQLVTQRTEAMKTQHQKEVDAIKAAADKANAELATIKIDQAIIAAAAKHGLRATAQTDVINRARAIFRLENGQVQPIGPDGKPIYGSKAEPLTPDEWVEMQTKEAPHLFEPSAGSGGKGSGQQGGGGAANGRNPFKAETLNRTAQAHLLRTDPATAKRLAAEAGITIP
jgi:hypothetical protein